MARQQSLSGWWWLLSTMALLLLLALSGATGESMEQTTDPRVHLEAARAHLSAGRSLEAIAAYEAALGKSLPHNNVISETETQKEGQE